MDPGELTVSATADIILTFFVLRAYWKGSQVFRKVSEDFAILIFLLVLFGVFFDMVGSAVGLKLGWIGEWGSIIIEESGEMIAGSLILWYVYLLKVRAENSGWYLFDLLSVGLTGHVTGKISIQGR